MTDPNILSFLQDCIHASKTEYERSLNQALYNSYLKGTIDCNWNADQTDITVRITDTGIAAAERAMAENTQNFYFSNMTPAEA